MKSPLRASLLLLFSAGLAGPAFAQCVFTSTPTGGLFTASSTWTVTGGGNCDTVPTSNSQVIIRGPVTLNRDFTFAGNSGQVVIDSTGSLMEDSTRRTLTLGTGSGAQHADHALVKTGGRLVVSELHLEKATLTVNGQTTAKCNLFVDNLGVLAINGRVIIQGNLHLETGNALLNGDGGLVIKGCVVGSNGALQNATAGNLVVCVQRQPTGCGTGVCNTDIPINNSANCIVLVPPVLPVELVAFKAAANSACACVRLTWQTASERNSKEFVIERSTDGKGFGAIGQRPAAGTTSAPQDYAWQDNRPLPGPSYYRLRQVDLDGTTAHSTIVSALATTGQAALHLLPTETNGTYAVGALGADATLTVLTTQGRTVRTQALPAAGGVLQLSGCPAGVYIVRAASALGTATTRLVHPGQ